MRILFDQGVPRALAWSLRHHEVADARQLGWERISNGVLLKPAEEAGLELIVTTDKNMRYQQNLLGRKIAIVVLGQSPWWLVRLQLVRITGVMDAATPDSFAEVDIPFQ